MTIYFLLFMYWGICGFVLKCSGNVNSLRVKYNSKIYFFVAGISLLLLLSLRGLSVGTDLNRYMLEYESGRLRYNERFFSYFNYILKNLGISFQMYLALIATINISAITLFFYKYSENIMLSYYLHVTIGLFAMSMSGLRQTLAASITIFAFILLMENRKKLFFILVGISYFFHNSAIIFLIVYFIKNIKINRRIGFIIYIFSTLAFIFRKWIFIVIGYITPYKYMIYLNNTEFSGMNPLVILVSMAIPLACLIFWPAKILEENEEKHKIMSVLLIMSCINMIINIFALNINMFERLTYYFITYNTVLIANVIHGMKNKEIRLIAYITCISLTMLGFIISVPGGSLGIDKYVFFWK